MPLVYDDDYSAWYIMQLCNSRAVSVVSHIDVGHRLDNIFFFFPSSLCVSCYILFCPGDFNTRNLPVLVSR